MSTDPQANQARFEPVPIVLLRESKTNPRQHFNEKKLAELAESVRRHGVVQPLLARPLAGERGMEIVAGARRFRAAKMAGIAMVPVYVVQLSDAEALEVQVIENLQREDVHEIEEAEGYERLLKLKGYTVELVAEKVGKDASYIYKRLKLLALIPDARAAFFEGQINAAHALILARLPSPKDQRDAFKSLFEEPTRWDEQRRMHVKIGTIVHSASALEAWVQANVYLDLAKASFAKDDAELLPKAGACTVCPKRTGANLALFDDAKKGDQCLDRACFHQKQNAHLVRIQKTAKAAGKPLVNLTQVYGNKNGDAYHYNVHAVEKPGDKCASAESAVWIDGARIGQVVEICRSKSCKKHSKTVNHNASGKQKSFAETWAEKRERLNERVSVEVDRALWREVVACVPEEFDRLFMVIVGERLIEQASHDGRRALCGALSIEGEKGPHSTDFAEPLRAHLINLADKDIPGFLVGLTLTGYNSLNGQEIAKLAEELKIDIDVAEKTIAEPLRAEFEKKKAKAGESHKKKLAAEKKAAKAELKGKVTKPAKAKSQKGVCRECGCTETTPCMDEVTGEMCAWTDKSKTLCTGCVEAAGV